MNKIFEMNEQNVLKEARELSLRINLSLPERVDPAGMTLESRIPFSTVSLREVLCHRVAELSSTALDLYESKKKISSYILMRACVETCASLYVLRKKIEIFLKDHDVEEFWSHVRSGLLGSREGDSKVKAKNILTFIDHVDKEHNGFRKMFDTLCEFAHPNHGGLLGAYSQYDKNKIWLDLGQEIVNIPPALGLAPFYFSLVIFEEEYNGMIPYLYKLNEHFEKKAT